MEIQILYPLYLGIRAAKENTMPPSTRQKNALLAQRRERKVNFLFCLIFLHNCHWSIFYFVFKAMMEWKWNVATSCNNKIQIIF